MRFGAMVAVARRQFCGNLHVTTPQQVQCKPPLRQAAGRWLQGVESPCVNHDLTSTCNNDRQDQQSR